MIIHAAFAAKAPRLSGIASPDFVPPCLLDALAISGPAQITARTQKPVGAEPALTLRLAERLVLLTESRRLREMRNSRAASISEVRLRAVTHDVLRMEIERARGC